jgi:hypothetical protein
MAKLTFEVRKNADDTITVRVGKQVEHISCVHKSKGEVYDAVRWCLISKGVSPEEPSLIEMLHKL